MPDNTERFAIQGPEELRFFGKDVKIENHLPPEKQKKNEELKEALRKARETKPG